VYRHGRLPERSEADQVQLRSRALLPWWRDQLLLCRRSFRAEALDQPSNQGSCEEKHDSIGPGRFFSLQPRHRLVARARHPQDSVSACVAAKKAENKYFNFMI